MNKDQWTQKRLSVARLLQAEPISAKDVRSDPAQMDRRRATGDRRRATKDRRAPATAMSAVVRPVEVHGVCCDWSMPIERSPGGESNLDPSPVPFLARHSRF